MKAVILKCPQPAKFRFGKAGLDVNSSLSTTEDILHADTLFSALITTAAKLYVEEATQENELSVKQIVEWFKTGEVSISSVFYCLEKRDGNYVYFLPKPSCYELFNEDASIRKWIRKVEFLSKLVWEQGILPKNWIAWSGQATESLSDDKAYIIDKKFAVTKPELEGLFSKREQENTKAQKIFSDSIRPRITDQVRQVENNFYFQSELFLPQHNEFKTHFFFLMTCKDKEKETCLSTLLEVLGDTGIGGRTSLGCGQLLGIEVQQNPFQFNIDKPHSHFVATASLVSPASLEELKSMHTYNLITRGGRRIGGGNEEEGESIQSILKRLKMLKEGAIAERSVVGKVQDISPSKNEAFLRYGKAFTIPIHESILSYESK